MVLHFLDHTNILVSFSALEFVSLSLSEYISFQIVRLSPNHFSKWILWALSRAILSLNLRRTGFVSMDEVWRSCVTFRSNCPERILNHPLSYRTERQSDLIILFLTWRVCAITNCEIVSAHPDYPNDGIFTIHVNLTPMGGREYNVRYFPVLSPVDRFIRRH